MFKYMYYVEFDKSLKRYVVNKRLHIFGILFYGGGFGPYAERKDAYKMKNDMNRFVV